ncbi:MAG: efflux RND transporter periplasmic adaptor subunit [Desulfuromonadales bacterium]|nr:efflux RND transporter periplasmic adaptor subunit [Desulfuromonadales bacterium]
MRKIGIAVLVIIAVVVIAGVIIPRKPPASDYRTAKVERGELVSTVSATGTLAAVVTVQVGTQVSGTISKLFVDFNSPVKAGQAIAQIDPALFNAKVKEVRGNYYNALANLERFKEEQADALRTLERNRELSRGGIISQADFDAAQTKYKVASAAVKAADWSVTQNQGLYEQSKTNLDYATIKSPTNGIVISRNVDVGQTVAASFQTPTLFTIAQDLTKMEIQVSVDEADISKVRLGQPVSFSVDSYSNLTFKGAVSQIRKAPILTQNVVTYIVIVSVTNQDLKLMPGMTANVSIETMRKQQVLKMPNAALLFNPESDDETPPDGAGKASKSTEKVYLLRKGQPVPVPVETGLHADGFVEVVASGALKENDEVIIERLTEKKKDANQSGGPQRGPGF